MLQLGAILIFEINSLPIFQIGYTILLFLQFFKL
jgi:hypothetical protein